MLNSAMSWFKALSVAGKIGVISAGVFGMSIVGAATSPPSQQESSKTRTNITSSAEEQKPKVTHKTISETKEIPFETSTIEDNTLAYGTTSTRTEGVNGVRTIEYDIEYTDGVETERKEKSNTITTQPITKVVAQGIYVAPKKPATSLNCDSNYSGACVPVASDVDCGGGSGNGPEYLYETATVVGSDIYDLDRDGDGLACE